MCVAAFYLPFLCRAWLHTVCTPVFVPAPACCRSCRYGTQLLQDELCGKVWDLNMRSFTLADPNDPKKCPYGSEGLTRFANCTKPA